MITLTVPSEREISQKKLETFARYNQVITWGRKNPIEFCKYFMGIDLLDYQKYMMLGSWSADFVDWLVCRNGGKTTEAAIYVMLRSMLFPMHSTYLVGNTGDQSREIYSKIEKITKKEIESFVGSTEVFFEEIRLSIAGGGDGFVHNPSSWKVELFNGSTINTLNSGVGDGANLRGKRAHLLVHDEVGFSSEELMVVTTQFLNQSEDFKLGGGVDLSIEPKNFPRQLLYCSSASDTDSEFYKKLRAHTLEMMSGNTHYFVCDLDADVVKSCTLNGDPYPSLLSQAKIDDAMNANKDKAMRELYNHFTSEAHEGQILTRRHLMRQTKGYLPIMRTEGGSHVYLLSWDSARINDGSIIEVAELINDPEIGYRLEMKNIFALVDPSTRNKTPMRIPQQVESFQRILLDFNGSHIGKQDYENIAGVVIDAGAAGQPFAISDSLVSDFIGCDGRMHKGIIDTSHKMNETAVHDFPNAVDIVNLVNPRAHREEMYQALEDAVKMGLVSFPMDYEEGKDYYNITKVQRKKGADGEEYADEEEESIPFTEDEKISLMQFEMLKTECITMCKYANNGNVHFDYPPDKRNKMHDDRIFAASLLCWKLMQLRRGQTLTNRHIDEDEEHEALVTSIDF